jgi:hypothetical protein
MAKERKGKFMGTCFHPQERVICGSAVEHSQISTSQIAASAAKISPARVKALGRCLALVLLALALVSLASASTVNITLDPNWGDYNTYTYSANGSSYSEYTGPYPAIISGGIYGSGEKAFLSCFDINVDTYIGQTYQGSLTIPDDTTQYEVSWLMNQLGLGGDEYNLPLSTTGPISMAIWQLENGSSVNPGTFVEDPTAQPWVNAAINAVKSGAWTPGDAAQHPFWSPTNPYASQRFGIVASGVPEPGSCALVGSALIGLGLFFRKRLKVN